MTKPLPADLAYDPIEDDDSHFQRPALGARLSHRLARHLPLQTMRLEGGPLVSFTFDDVPETALTQGASLLEEHDARGTFYIAGGLLDMVTADWRVINASGVCELHARGHEIGCHSFTHKRADRVDGDFIANDILRNRAFLQMLEPGLRLEHFAYPFGYGSFAWKRRLARVFRSCRGIGPGLNAGRIDPQFLRALPLYSSRLDTDAIARALDQASRKNGWLIFYSHDITTAPSEYGCTPALLSHALRSAEQRGISCVTISQGMDKLVAA